MGACCCAIAAIRLCAIGRDSARKRRPWVAHLPAALLPAQLPPRAWLSWPWPLLVLRLRPSRPRSAPATSSLCAPLHSRGAGGGALPAEVFSAVGVSGVVAFSALLALSGRRTRGGAAVGPHPSWAGLVETRNTPRCLSRPRGAEEGSSPLLKTRQKYPDIFIPSLLFSSRSLISPPRALPRPSPLPPAACPPWPA